MTDPVMVDVAFWVFGLAAVWTGWRVFRTDSMVRASFLLLASFLNVGSIMLLLGAEYLGFALFFMMTVEMIVMALFMVMFMMNPAGLNPMMMVHQHRLAIAAGVAAFAALAAVAVFGVFPDRPVGDLRGSIAALGTELLDDSMLIFESAGVTLLATMVGAIALSSHRGRFGASDEGSEPPPLDPERPQDGPAQVEPQASAGHHGHH